MVKEWFSSPVGDISVGRGGGGADAVAGELLVLAAHLVAHFNKTTRLRS